MKETQVDANEASSDLEELGYELDDQEYETDEIAESSTAQDEDSDSSPDEGQEDLSPDEIKALNSEKANQRFSEITQKEKDARAEAAALRAETQALRERLEAMESAEVPNFDESAPSLDDFDDYEQYQAASVAYEAAKAAHNVMSRTRQASQEAIKKRSEQTLFEQHQQKRQALVAKAPDLAEALGQTYLNSQTEGGGATAQAILRAPNGAEVEYHIAKNPELASRLNNMDQFSAIGEVARLSEQLKVKPKKRDPLPDPVGPTPSGGGKTNEHQPKFSAGATYE